MKVTKINTVKFVVGLWALSCACGGASSKKNQEQTSTSASSISEAPPAIDQGKMREYAVQALVFCRQRGWNTEKAILIDMGLHSGRERLFVWNFKTDTIDKTTLVSHGCGSLAWGKDGSKTAPKFSNIENSHSSSLGKYKIGKRGKSQWGTGVNYLLHGLDTSNSNALKREIVLHGWDAIGDQVTYPNGTPEGWGCPAVSNATMHYLDQVLQSSSKPMLLWIYN